MKRDKLAYVRALQDVESAYAAIVYAWENTDREQLSELCAALIAANEREIRYRLGNGEGSIDCISLGMGSVNWARQYDGNGDYIDE